MQATQLEEPKGNGVSLRDQREMDMEICKQHSDWETEISKQQSEIERYASSKARLNLALLITYLHFPLVPLVSNGYLIVEVLDYSVLPCFSEMY